MTNIPLCMNLQKAIHQFAKCDPECLYNIITKYIIYNGYPYKIIENENNCLIIENNENLHIYVDVLPDLQGYEQKIERLVVVCNVTLVDIPISSQNLDLATINYNKIINFNTLFKDDVKKYYYITTLNQFEIKKSLYDYTVDSKYWHLIIPFIYSSLFKKLNCNYTQINNTITSINKFVILHNVCNFLEQAINYKCKNFYHIASFKKKELFIISNNDNFSLLKIKQNYVSNQEPIIIDNRQHFTNSFFQVNIITNQYIIYLSKEMSCNDLIMTVHNDSTLFKYKKCFIDYILQNL